MRKFISVLLGSAALTASAAAVAQTPGGVNVGSLNCTVSGGMGFVFGSSKDLNCIYVRPDGSGDRYVGVINKYGVDVGFTKEAHIVWLVFAPGAITPGALAGEYGGATASATVGVGAGANVLIGGSSKQYTLQPVSVEGSTGLNIAAGVAGVTLRAAAR